MTEQNLAELCPHCFKISYFVTDDKEGNIFADLLVCSHCELEFENLNDHKFNKWLLEEEGEKALIENEQFYWAAKIYK